MKCGGTSLSFCWGSWDACRGCAHPRAAEVPGKSPRLRAGSDGPETEGGFWCTLTLLATPLIPLWFSGWKEIRAGLLLHQNTREELWEIRWNVAELRGSSVRVKVVAGGRCSTCLAPWFNFCRSTSSPLDPASSPWPSAEWPQPPHQKLCIKYPFNPQWVKVFRECLSFIFHPDQIPVALCLALDVQE